MKMKGMYKRWIMMSMMGLMSCGKWLSVSPEHEVVEQDLFTTADGYRNLLNGIYQEMGTAKLYGQELTWGLLDVMAQYYQVEWCNSEIAYRVVGAGDVYDYMHVTVEPKLTAIWVTTFNLIANCNNLLKHIETTDSTLFADGKGEMERRLIRGEALALRAFLHFDMLRLFAPAPGVADGERRVPYCDVFPSIDFPSLTTGEVLSRVIRDLQAAQQLTATFDTLYRGAIHEVDSRLGDALTPGVGEFLSFRGYRLNYYAITGLLARVYLYRGDGAGREAALREAGTVISSLLFDFTPTQEVREGNTKLYEDVIFGLYNSKLTDIYSIVNQDWGSSYSYLFLKDREELAALDKDDVRVGESLVVKRKDRDVCGKYFVTVNTGHGLNNKLIPMLRLSELCHIYTECAYDEREAKAMLSYLRLRRDAKREIAISMRERLYEELLVDARKEYTGEGQLFYMYKRLNRNITVGGKTYDMKRNFVLPIPRVEINVN